VLPTIREGVQVDCFDVSHNVAGIADGCLADKLLLAINDAKVLAAIMVCTPRMGAPHYSDLMCDIYKSVTLWNCPNFLGARIPLPHKFKFACLGI
jgi:hypothetical protein